jgi:hypothetical protein
MLQIIEKKNDNVCFVKTLQNDEYMFLYTQKSELCEEKVSISYSSN